MFYVFQPDQKANTKIGSPTEKKNIKQKNINQKNINRTNRKKKLNGFHKMNPNATIIIRISIERKKPFHLRIGNERSK